MKCQDKNKCCYLCHRFADDCEGIVPKKIISCGDCILVDDCTYEENQEYQAELKREREYIQDNKDRQGSTGSFRDTWGGSIY
jgi:hypothetical protein